MPDDSNPKNKPEFTPESTTETELKSGALDSSPLPGPVPAVEQEPQTSATTTPSQSAAAQQPVQGFAAAPQSSTGGNTGGSKKKWIIGGIIAGALALLLGGGALAYFAYQNPDKVIADGIVNLFNSQPGTVKAILSAENNDAKMNFALDVKSNDKVATGTLKAVVSMKSQQLDLSGSADFAATVDGDGYVKLNDIDQLADKVVNAMVDAQAEQYKAFGLTITEKEIEAQKKQTLAQIKPIIEKINNRWIKFTTTSNDEVSEQQKCLTDTFKKLQSDRAMRDEFAKVYADNKFINVKEQLGVKDGSYGYVLDLDTAKADSFGKAAETTTFFKELEKCGGASPSASSAVPSNDDSVKDMRIELWVSQWSHQITGLKIEGTDTSSSSTNPTKVSFDMNVGYDKVDGLEVPKDAVDFKDLEKEFQQLNPMGTTPTSSSSLSI